MSDLCDELQAARPPGPAAVAFGVFDGVHRGHRHVLEQLKRAAAERGLIPAVVTLANHPLSVLRPQMPVVFLSSLHDRLELLRKAGIEHVVPITFTREVSFLSAERFMRELAECLGLRHLVVGPDAALGHDRQGTPDVLATLGTELGFTVETAEHFTLDGNAVRSTAIRQALAAGDLATAGTFLGRPFSLEAPVVEGEQRGGGLLGFPTANLGLGPLQALPADGIYATWFHVDGRRYASATSVGTKPTFHEDGPRVVEAFVLEFDGDLYGKQVRLEFVQHLRGQERYDSVDDLVAQMERDVEQTRAILAAAAKRGGA